MKVRLLLLALVLVTALAGCAGDDDSGDWAGGVCAEVNDWADEVDATIESLGEQGLELDEDDLRAAADRVSEATDELEAGLEDLGPPETEQGQEAEAELERLADELREQLGVIEGALGGNDPLEGAATVATAFAAAANEVQRSIDTLESLDPGGELADDFEDSDECDELRERVENTGS